jgi:hypothetical protein
MRERGATSLLFDAGSLGLPPLYGHGHADALSIALSSGGRPLIVDPGTYAYYRGERWRRFFRGTASHATLSIEDQDQAASGGPFLWESDVPARLLSAERKEGGRFEAAGEHDGYRRLPGSPVVRRGIVAEREGSDGRTTTIRITDTIEQKGGKEPTAEPPRISIAFPLDAALEVAVTADPARGAPATVVSARSGGVTLSIEGPRGLSLEIARGKPEPGGEAGWQSRAFSKKEKSATVLFKGRGRGPFVTTIRVTAEESAPGQ